jgi:hypothetical protein
VNTLARAEANPTPGKKSAAKWLPPSVDWPGAVFFVFWKNLGRFLGSATHYLPSSRTLNC